MVAWVDEVSWLLQRWRQEDFRWCVLRAVDSLPVVTGHDIDLLVHPDDWARNRLLLDAFARRFGLRPHKHIPMPYANRFYYRRPGVTKELILDFHVNEQWLGAVFFTADDILRHRVDRGVAFGAHEVHMALAPFLVTLLSTGVAANRYWPNVLAAQHRHPELFHRACRRAVGQVAADLVVEAAYIGQPAVLASRCRYLAGALYLRALGNDPLATMARFGKTAALILWFKRIRRIYPP